MLAARSGNYAFCGNSRAFKPGNVHMLPNLRPGVRRRAVQVAARYGRSSDPTIVDRVVACLPYLLPYLDAVGYGRFLFLQYPVVKSLVAPLAPLISLYASIPFASLIAFFGVYLGIVQNTSFSRFVRVNAMQAVLLDILLILPRLIESVVGPPTAGWAVQAYITGNNTIWIFVAACVGYAVISAILGQLARIPLVGDAAEQQVMR